MAGDLILPVQKVTRENAKCIDLSRLLDGFESQCTKFFEKEAPSKVKEQRNELLSDMADNEVMIRVETVRSKQAMHATMTPVDVEAFVAANQNVTVHEVLVRPIAKLFFDIDEPLDAIKKFDVARFERAVHKRLEADGYDVTDLQCFVSQREDCRKKISFHIAFNIVL